MKLGLGLGLCRFNAVLDLAHVNTWIQCTGNRYFSTSDDRAEVSRVKSERCLFSTAAKQNEPKLHIMQRAMHKRQKLECSGHTGVFDHPHYISLLSSFRPVQKTAQLRWNFHMETILCSQDIYD
jgi:hypothetical protein